MEKQNSIFYCYSPFLMHYLKACGLFYIQEGTHLKSNTPYYMFERCEKLDRALNEWAEFKARHMEAMDHAE